MILKNDVYLISNKVDISNNNVVAEYVYVTCACAEGVVRVWWGDARSPTPWSSQYPSLITSLGAGELTYHLWKNKSNVILFC